MDFNGQLVQTQKLDASNKLIAINKHSGKLASNSRSRLIKEWNLEPHQYLKCLVDETKAGRIEWVESQSGKSFTIHIDEERIVKLRYSTHKGLISFSLTKKRNGKRSKSIISEQEFKELYEAIKCEEFIVTAKTNDITPKTAKEKKTEVIYVKEVDELKQSNIYAGLVQIGKRKNNNKRQLEYEKMVHRLQRNDEENGSYIRKTHSGRITWSRVTNSSLKGNVYISVDEDGNKLLLNSYSDDRAFLYRFYINGEKNSIGGIQKYLEMMIVRKLSKELCDVDLSEYIKKEVKQPVIKNVISESKSVSKKRRVNIGIKDLVVRRNIFKCMHNKHSIEDVDAVVKIMNKNIEIEEVVVLAGYCKQCKAFFILESTYQQLLRKGIVAFRTVDEKSYLSQSYLNGKLLAQESILMQFGYTVSQTEGLSEERRHKILSVLVDNRILTKSEIISYLDFFISQRKSDKFALAVAKWTIDRNYIRNYKIGEYSRIGVVYKNDI